MADKFDYDVDAYTNEQEARSSATSIFFSCGLPLATVFFPELVKLYMAGHNFLMFLLALGLYSVGAAVFLNLIAKPIRKKVYGVKRQDFRIESLILLFTAIAVLIVYARYKFGIFV